MKPSLTSGLSRTRQLRVDESRVIGFMGDKGRVYATPALVMDIETTCRDLLLEHLDEGEDTVGTRIEINHTAATPLGMEVDIAATVASIDRRAVTFEIVARDMLDQIADGRHTRFVVDVAKTLERISMKAQKIGSP
ncbi:MAG: thioesterase family protein [Alphaproteobacteria bacterium]